MAAPVALAFRIAANLDDLRANLAQAEASIETTTASMTRMTNALDGSKLIADANAMVVAIDKIGGVSNLTAAEQAKVNATVTAAIEKYQALGETAPAALQQLEASTASAAVETTTLSESLRRVAGLFGVAFGGAALVQFGLGLLTLGEQLETTAANTGLTVAEVQKLSYIADQSGTSIDAVTSAVEHLEKNLGTGNTGATTAMKGLGIATSDFLKLDAYEQMEVLAQKISAIQDPTQRAAAEFELFGRSGQQIGSVLAHFQELAAQAPVASDETVAALARFERELKALQTEVEVWAGAVFTFISHLGDNAVIYVGSALEKTYSLFAAFAQSLANSPLATLYQKLYGIDVSQLATQASQAQRFFHDLVQAQVGQLDQLAKATDQTAPHVGGLGNAFSLAKPKVDEFQRAVQSMVASISGADLAKKVQELNAAVNELGGASKLSTPELQKVSDEAANLFKQGAVLTPQLTQTALAFNGLLPKVETGIKDFKDLGDSVRVIIPADQELLISVDALQDKLQSGTVGLQAYGFAGRESAIKVSDGFKEAVQAGKDAQKAIDDAAKQTEKDLQELARAFDQIGSAIGGNIGAAISDFGHLITAVQAARSAFSGLSDAPNLLSKISLSITGIMGIASAAIGPVESLFNHFFGTAGRDAVVQFADSMGGFDALHQKLDLLGADGEQLWVNLTQGVGRNNPQQAQAAIDAVTKALNDQQSALNQLNADGTPTYDTLTQLQQKYNLTAAQMGPAFQEQQIDSQFQSILKDLTLLTKGGTDVAAAMFTVGADGSKSLSGLGTAIRDDIQQAINAGVAIPANLKDAAAALVANNDLLSATGQQITGINQLTFGNTIQTDLETLNETLQKFIDTLNGKGGLTDALNAVPRNVDITFNERVVGAAAVAQGAATGGYVSRGRILPFPTMPAKYFDVGGSVFQPQGTDTVPAMLTPGEIVLNAAQQRNIAGLMGGAAGGVTVISPVIVDGREIARVVKRHLPGELIRSGVGTGVA